jgi:indole-3-glycerol phosphate synthase
MTNRGKEPAGGILDRIVEARRVRVEAARRAVPLAEVRREAEAAHPPISFKRALASRPGISVIAEMKRSSPAAGELDPNLDPAVRAGVYCRAGAAAISVLTEPDFFGGFNADLTRAKHVAVQHDVAILQKDFVFDEYQVYEARAAGADAVLLIIAILSPALYAGLLETANALGMDALVEVFDGPELEIALRESPAIVGVNNRNLKTLETSLTVFETLARQIPAAALKVAESGMKNESDVARMGRAGAKAVLVGESLMRAGEDAGALVRSMAKATVG